MMLSKKKVWCKEHIITCKKPSGCRNNPHLKKVMGTTYFVIHSKWGPQGVGGGIKGVESSPLRLCFSNNLLTSHSWAEIPGLKQPFQKVSSSPTIALHPLVSHVARCNVINRWLNEGFFLLSIASTMKKSLSESMSPFQHTCPRVKTKVTFKYQNGHIVPNSLNITAPTP